MLLSLARGAARVAQKDIGVEEMMIAIGLDRARLGLGKWMHLTFHSKLALGGLAGGSESTNAACGNRVNKSQPSARFYRRDNELDMN